MQIKILKSSVLISALLLPSLVFAGARGVFGVLVTVKNILDAIIPILITLALIYFLIGVGNYILTPGGLDKARDQMLYGLVGLFVMVSVWGLVRLLAETFSVQTGTTQETVPGVAPVFPRN